MTKKTAPHTKKIALRAPKIYKTAPKKAPKKSTKAVKKTPKRSHLEVRWIREWERQGGPELVEEFMFHPTRKWRADFAHLESRLLIEIEGGAYGGRHTRGKGFVEDLDKYAAAWLAGYTVLRIGAHQVKGYVIRAVIERIKNHSPESQCENHSPESHKEGSGGRPGEGAGEVDRGGDGIAGRSGAVDMPPPVWLIGAR